MTGFTLQEDTDWDFADPTNYELSASTTSKSFTDKDGGTYYYRVRGNNTWGQGEWSSVKSVSVFSYYDNFSDYKSGWPREWEKTRGALYQVHPHEHPKCPGDDCEYDEGDGYIIARRSGSNPTARFGPDVSVPSENYEIELKSRWWDAAYFATYQIFFGSDDDFDNYYALQVRINIEGGSSGDCEYSLIRHDKSLVGYGGIASVESTKNLQNWTGADDQIHCGLRSRTNTSWNEWRIRREGDEIKIWVNGKKLGTWEDSKYGADRYFGVGCTLYEGFTPSKPVFDNFSVEIITSD